MTTSEKQLSAPRSLPLWVSGLIPLVALALMLAVFAYGNPLAMFTADLPPIESLTFERVVVTPSGFEAQLINGGPDPVTVAQVMVDDAYWQFTASPSATIPRLGRAVLAIPYPWVEGRAARHPHRHLDGRHLRRRRWPSPRRRRSPGCASSRPTACSASTWASSRSGLGLLWYPVMKRMGRKWLGAVLALTLGLLVFLLIDTLLEAFEVAAALPGAFQGIPLVLFAALLTWLVLLAIGAARRNRPATRHRRPGGG